MPKSQASPRDSMTAVRKYHAFVIARLLNDSASKHRVPHTTIANKLAKVALKMEFRIFKLTRGRLLDENAIQLYLTHLTQQAHRRHRRQLQSEKTEMIKVA
ncbi:hypothetical protein SPRG_11065 [Saprolegnia parasitica CBS 223.65]|uniref:Uncharacterized protein n=1 Tax=Saprolegnia parasitica (strain CBS 223.65) TaxID=695850 RepID=A0A067BZB3_SAPPC|nr:hypothetical protein SPRG_11065 [Saprolegnia parasitica CBS 223.65]KDO23618.1 hypothetical protein SPRG_11065 [Saprolegnia parasitica CBS 223.65]|eukprot:XP_012205602.1 hypothetical protein SPRG_11065 [Saprolegnia parasitica CBS 223.65]